VTGIDQDVLIEVEEAPDRAVLLVRRRNRIALCVQVRSTHVTDEQGVPGEDEPGLLATPLAISDYIGEMSRSVPRRCHGAHNSVPELDHLSARKGRVRKLDTRALRKVGGGPGSLDECRKSGYVVRLHMGLEDRHDRSSRALGRLEVRIDELNVGIYDRKRRTREAAE
jgi:hypothetical protein